MSERIDVDVVIAGGGILALAAAVALRQAGMSVAVIERGLCGAGASGVNFGGVSQEGRELVELPLAARSQKLWESLTAFLGEDVEFDVSGHIKFALSEADMAELDRYADDARAYGLDLTLLGPNAVRAALPWLGVKVVGASLSPTDGQANPRVVGPAYARLARRLGVIVREHTTVLGATATGRGFELDASGELTVLSRFLINACGAASNLIAAAFGEPTPLTELTPNILVTEPLPYFISRSIGVVAGDVFVRQVRRGNVIFSGNAGYFDAERALARPVSERSIDGMRRALELVPSLAEANIIRTWSGVDGQMPDNIPVIGFSLTTPNLVHAFGFSGHGFQLGPAVGVILSELILGGETKSPIAPFSIARFAGWTGGDAKIQGDAAK